jgi:hypothetical protein
MKARLTLDQLNAVINMKQALVNALITSEEMRGRTNISKLTIQNFGLYANKLVHNK